MNSQPGEITDLLARWQRGDRAALEHLTPLIRQELVSMARRRLAREGNRNSLQPSSLVQEVFLRLLPVPEVDWRNRAHFFAAAAEGMRRIRLSASSCQVTSIPESDSSAKM